jgi:hypothetical protein
MKQFLTIFFTIITVALHAQSAQSKGASSTDCFKEWFTLFKERGATAIADGTHDVIISLRSGTYSDCYMGKIDVAGGKLTGKLLVQKVDGTYEEFDKKVSSTFQNASGVLKDELREVNNGMSEQVTLTDGETIRLFFFRSLAEKEKANKKAPNPATLVK